MSESEAQLKHAEVRGSCVRFAWSDGLEAEFASAWLLDNASSADGSVGGHRARTAHSLALAGAIQSVSVTGDAARLAFAGETVEWPGSRLRACADRPSGPDASDETTLWPRGTELAGRPAIDFATYLADDGALEAALSDVVRFGLARLTAAGVSAQASEQTVGRFGFIRETNYGRLFEVRVVANPDHLANTVRALEPHTDNPYRDPAPTLQVLHCITASNDGGATFFLDGFALAEGFRKSHPDDFARLAAHAVPFVFAAADGEHYQARSPVVRLTADGRLAGLRLNHRAMGAVDLGAAETARWYDSYLRFANAADAPERRMSLAMKPGDLVLFDNERILHGRDAFSPTADRLLRGCYADRDGLRATLARLRHRSMPAPTR
jgi:alpha-ketoglutarate-dependent taurine dioxygenase